MVLKGANAAPFTPAGAHGRSTPESLITAFVLWGEIGCTFTGFVGCVVMERLLKEVSVADEKNILRKIVNVQRLYY
ncbi:MAG: hypothetical protein ACI4J4_09270 [Ruminiclostridium sp.]